jgi:hypothetical protein
MQAIRPPLFLGILITTSINSILSNKLPLKFLVFQMASKPSVHRQLGKNGPSIPALGFGLMGMSYVTYGSIPSDEERFAILDRAAELGETFWDSSE